MTKVIWSRKHSSSLKFPTSFISNAPFWSCVVISTLPLQNKDFCIDRGKGRSPTSIDSISRFKHTYRSDSIIQFLIKWLLLRLPCTKWMGFCDWRLDDEFPGKNVRCELGIVTQKLKSKNKLWELYSRLQ